MPRPATARDYELAAQLAKLPGYALVGTREIAAITGFALTSIRQRKVVLPPAAFCSRRKILWRLQDVRDWLAKLSSSRGVRRAASLRLRGEVSRRSETPIDQRASQ